MTLEDRLQERRAKQNKANRKAKRSTSKIARISKAAFTWPYTAVEKTVNKTAQLGNHLWHNVVKARGKTWESCAPEVDWGKMAKWTLAAPILATQVYFAPLIAGGLAGIPWSAAYFAKFDESKFTQQYVQDKLSNTTPVLDGIGDIVTTLSKKGTKHKIIQLKDYGRTTDTLHQAIALTEGRPLLDIEDNNDYLWPDFFESLVRLESGKNLLRGYVKTVNSGIKHALFTSDFETAGGTSPIGQMYRRLMDGKGVIIDKENRNINAATKALYEIEQLGIRYMHEARAFSNNYGKIENPPGWDSEYSAAAKHASIDYANYIHGEGGDRKGIAFRVKKLFNRNVEDVIKYIDLTKENLSDENLNDISRLFTIVGGLTAPTKHDPFLSTIPAEREKAKERAHRGLKRVVQSYINAQDYPGELIHPRIARALIDMEIPFEYGETGDKFADPTTSNIVRQEAVANLKEMRRFDAARNLEWHVDSVETTLEKDVHDENLYLAEQTKSRLYMMQRNGVFKFDEPTKLRGHLTEHMTVNRPVTKITKKGIHIDLGEHGEGVIDAKGFYHNSIKKKIKVGDILQVGVRETGETTKLDLWHPKAKDNLIGGSVIMDLETGNVLSIAGGEHAYTNLSNPGSVSKIVSTAFVQALGWGAKDLVSTDSSNKAYIADNNFWSPSAYGEKRGYRYPSVLTLEDMFSVSNNPAYGSVMEHATEKLSLQRILEEAIKYELTPRHIKVTSKGTETEHGKIGILKEHVKDDKYARSSWGELAFNMVVNDAYRAVNTYTENTDWKHGPKVMFDLQEYSFDKFLKDHERVKSGRSHASAEYSKIVKHARSNSKDKVHIEGLQLDNHGRLNYVGKRNHTILTAADCKAIIKDIKANQIHFGKATIGMHDSYDLAMKDINNNQLGPGTTNLKTVYAAWNGKEYTDGEKLTDAEMTAALLPFDHKWRNNLTDRMFEQFMENLGYDTTVDGNANLGRAISIYGSLMTHQEAIRSILLTPEGTDYSDYRVIPRSELVKGIEIDGKVINIEPEDFEVPFEKGFNDGIYNLMVKASQDGTGKSIKSQEQTGFKSGTNDESVAAVSTYDINGRKILDLRYIGTIDNSDFDHTYRGRMPTGTSAFTDPIRRMGKTLLSQGKDITAGIKNQLEAFKGKYKQ